jgi:glucose/arabinose dehydrogenase
MRRRAVHGVVAALSAVALAGCATFPDEGPRDWREQLRGAGELGGPPVVPDTALPGQPPPPGGSGNPGAPPVPSECADPDPQVVATCLAPVGAIAVLPDARSALVAERTTGRVLRVERGVAPELVATVPVDGSGDGGLTGLVLSPAYGEDQLVYAYATTAEDNRVVRIAGDEPPKAVLTGIPRGERHNRGALAVDGDGNLLVATGDAGDPAPGPLAGKLLRIDTLGRPSPANPDPASPVLSSGLSEPGGVCTDPSSGTAWVTDRAGSRDVLHRVVPGPLVSPAWTWPERPGVAGCMAQPGVVVIAETGSAAIFVLRPTDDGTFVGNPETLLADTYGRLSAAALAPDGLLWLGTVNKDGAPGATPVATDDRVIRIQPPAGGGESRA